MLAFTLQEIPQYILPPATATALGGVIVPPQSGLTVDAQGNLGISDTLSISSVDSGVQISSDGNITAPSFTFNVAGYGGGVQITPTQNALPGPQLSLPDGTVRAASVIATEGLTSQGNIVCNNLILNQPIPGEQGGINAFSLNINGAAYVQSFNVNGTEVNTAIQYALNVDGTEPVNVSTGINCLLVTLSQDVDDLTINLPGVAPGTVFEISINGNVTNLTFGSPDGFGPILGAPDTVVDYLAAKFRAGYTAGNTGSLAFFLVA
jgi:hypothetical protein